MAFLRPAKLLAELGPGDFIELSVLELEVHGRARVVSVEPCPPIESGAGRVVTGTFSSQSCDVRLLRLDRLVEPIEVTGNHPIFSEDRHDFIPAYELAPGERLRGRNGSSVVESVTKKQGRWEVFNLEIERDHRYYVSDCLVLVHNANGILDGSYDDVVGDGMLTESERNEIQDIANKYDTRIDVVGSRAAGEGNNIETNFPVGHDEVTERSDIDFKIDNTHPAVDDLIADLKAVGNGAGTAGRFWSYVLEETRAPAIRFTPFSSP
jgi:hypothetical protein